MKNTKKNETMIPTTREQSLAFIIRAFLKSNEQTLKLALSEQEVSELEKNFPEIYIKNGNNIYKSQNGLLIYNVFKH